jgi:hypothetical protein
MKNYITYFNTIIVSEYQNLYLLLFILYVGPAIYVFINICRSRKYFPFTSHRHLGWRTSVVTEAFCPPLEHLILTTKHKQSTEVGEEI